MVVFFFFFFFFVLGVGLGVFFIFPLLALQKLALLNSTLIWKQWMINPDVGVPLPVPSYFKSALSTPLRISHAVFVG